MGVYLSKPVTDKVSLDCENSLLKCGASSMQGWRVTQEDAHNCCLDFDEGTALFAVYDGHGGHEVAEYSATQLPDIIKKVDAYKNKDYGESLKRAFMAFDATLKEEAVIEELKKIAAKNKSESPGHDHDEEEDDDSDEGVDNLEKLKKEAVMPISDVMAQYTSITKTPLQQLSAEACGKPISPYLKAKSSHITLSAPCSTTFETAFTECEVTSTTNTDKPSSNTSDNENESLATDEKEALAKDKNEALVNGQVEADEVCTSECPGRDSGCTAVVALVREKEVYVANAGDSRAVLCREGLAVDMSEDHKPEDNVEMERITKAGGRVTNDGRVNGGLNLSRALGDHTYKQVSTLDASEQMIIALPDVRKEELVPDRDEFLVLACDGIWNSMTSQDVVDFVRPLIEKGEKLSSICEKLFDKCLAPDTFGDGTGCDNMTCVIIQFLYGRGEKDKRCASPMEENDHKKLKMEID